MGLKAPHEKSDMDRDLIRRYFLTSQEELRRDDFELTADQKIFRLVEEVESGLVDDYVLGTLSPADKISFEKHYLITDARRSKVTETRILVRIAEQGMTPEKECLRASSFSFFRRRALAYCTAAFLVFGIATTLFLMSPDKGPVEVVTVDGPLRNDPKKENPSSTTAAGDEPVAPAGARTGKKATRFTPAAISISPTRFRSSGKEVLIAQDETRAPFLLKLETEPAAHLFSAYAVKIETPEGGLVQTSSTIVKKTKTAVTVSLVGNFDMGTYIVYLVGLAKNDESEPVGEYVFKVIKR